MKAKTTNWSNPQQTKMPKPGDYAVGSLESRAAARALLDAKSEGTLQNRMRFVVEKIGKPVSLEASSCIRYPCTDTHHRDRTLVVELLTLDGAHPTATQLEQIEQWIRKVPIDGRSHCYGVLSH